MLKIIIIVLNVALLLSIAWRIVMREDRSMRFIFWSALGFKFLCGILLGLLYTYYYSSGDTFVFFQDGSTLSALARDNVKEYIRFLWSGDESFFVWNQLYHSQYRSLFFTKLISAVSLITIDNYWITSLYFSFVSFLGGWYLVKRIIEFFPGSKLAAVISFLFFPSVTFWSSGVIKEAIAIPGLFFLASVFLMIWHNKKLNYLEWFLLPVALLFVWKLKYFYLGLFIPIACATLATKYISERMFESTKFSLQLFTWVLLSGVGLFVINFLHPNFHLDYFPEVIVMNYNDYVRLSLPENVIHFNDLEPGFISLLQHSPKALFSGLFRPFIWEANSFVKVLAAVENLILFVLMVSSFSLVRHTSSKYRLITFAILIYSILLCITLTLSTPNIGTLARYRIGFLPFLIFILVYRNPFFLQAIKSAERLFLRLVRQY